MPSSSGLPCYPTRGRSASNHLLITVAEMHTAFPRFVPLLLLAFLHVSVVLGSEVFRYPEGRFRDGELRYVNDVPVLIVQGSHHEIGEQVGTLALKHAARVVHLVNAYADEKLPKTVRPFADVAVRSMYARFPREYRDELEAMATAAEVDLGALIRANTIIDLHEMIGCSSLMVSREHSTTGGPLYGRNLDVPYVKGLAELSLLIVYHPRDCHAFALPNIPGFLMFSSGMNSRGLALGSQSVGPPNDGSQRFNPTGEPSAVVGRRLIERCGSVEEVGSWLERHRLMRCVSIAACDRDRQSVFELTTERVLRRNATDGLCCATNHFRHEELVSDNECWRYKILDGSRKKDRLGIENVAALMKATSQGQMTIHTMIIEPQPLVIHLAMGAGPAADYPLKTIALAGLFDSTVQNPSDRVAERPHPPEPAVGPASN